MFGKLSNSKMRPSALGTTLNSSVYGQVIPPYYGRTRGALYQIWAANFRKGSSGKKGKKAGKKGAPPTYIENVDFLVGSNPIVTPLQFWANENDEYLLDFDVYSVSKVAYTSGTITIPDAAFYALIAVTIDETISFPVDDFGGPGASTQTGSTEHPLWNFAYAGPDLAKNASAYFYPYCYEWQPGSGATVNIPAVEWGTLAGNFNLYYAKLIDGKVPTSQLRLTFEPQLGDGPEYSGYSGQQIIYPHYAGLGSENFDLGSGAMPNVRGEFLGAHSVHKDGDCDFVDIIQDIFKSGITQAGFGSDQAYSSIQRGLNCYNLPGIVQSGKRDTTLGVNELKMPLPATAGNFLVVMHSGFFSAPSACSDTAGTTFTEVFNGNLNSGFSATVAIYVGQVPANTADNVVTVTGAGGNDSEIAVFEIAGVDTLDTFTINQRDDSAGSGEITTTAVPGRPAYLFALTVHNISGYPQPTEDESKWQPGPVGTYYLVSDRRVSHADTYTYESTGISTSTITALFSFTNSQPVSYPRVFGDILDHDSLELTRAQCRAYGLWGSLCMDSQKKASEWLQDLFDSAIAAPVWSGFSLKIRPYCEVSAAGNGSYYTAPTQPVFDLTPDDMIGDSSGQCITIEHSSPQVDEPNVLQMQHPNRGSDYNDVVTSEPVAATIALYGPRKESPKNVRCIQDTAVARKVLSVRARRLNLIRDKYTFTAQASKGKLLEAMDTGYISDPVIGMDRVKVRLTSIEEDEKFQLKCEAEPFYYGLHLPGELAVTTPSAYKPSTGTSPADVNTPIFIEPVPGLIPNSTQAQLWVVVSDSDESYGGCQVLVSTDGGSSYNSIGTITGNSVTGETTADWAAHSDPDTTNDLAVDVSESLGEIDSVATVDEDNLVYPAYVEGGTADIPYELMTYGTATLTGANLYTLPATGGGHKLRRSVHSAPTAGNGVFHASGSRFALLNPAGEGILKVNLDPKWVGVTLYFKFLAFNSHLNGLQSASDVTPYTYTPTGTVGSLLGQVFLVDGNGPGALGATTVAGLTAHNVAAPKAYNKANYPANFSGTTSTDQDGTTASVDSTKVDDSYNPVTPANVSYEDVHKMLATHLTIPHYAHLVPFTGNASFGENCNTVEWVNNAINQMINCGYNGVVIDWYGEGTFSDKVTLKIQANLAARVSNTFKFIIQADHGIAGLTQAVLITQVTYLQSQYFSDANYGKISTKPVLQFFDVDTALGNTAMAAAKAATTGSTAFWMPKGAGNAGQSWVDGVMDWTHDWHHGEWTGADTYNHAGLLSFVSTAISSGKPYWIALCPGFDGTLTRSLSWSLGKYLPRDSGACWLSVASYLDGIIDSNCAGVQTATFNDLKEGSNVEFGIENDITVSASISTTNLNWSVSGGTGDESTIAHYDLYASSDGQNVTLMDQINTGVGTYDLTTAGLTAGTAYTLYVKAIGKPNVRNHTSAGVAYTA